MSHYYNKITILLTDLMSFKIVSFSVPNNFNHEKLWYYPESWCNLPLSMTDTIFTNESTLTFQEWQHDQIVDIVANYDNGFTRILWNVGRIPNQKKRSNLVQQEFHMNFHSSNLPKFFSAGKLPSLNLSTKQ